MLLPYDPDGLWGRYKVTIEHEAFLTARQCLLALPGSTRDDVRRVLSDTSSLLQCDAFLRDMPGVRREAAADPADAARLIAQNGWRYFQAPCMEFGHTFVLGFDLSSLGQLFTMMTEASGNIAGMQLRLRARRPRSCTASRCLTGTSRTTRRVTSHASSC